MARMSRYHIGLGEYLFHIVYGATVAFRFLFTSEASSYLVLLESHQFGFCSVFSIYGHLLHLRVVAKFQDHLKEYSSEPESF